MPSPSLRQRCVQAIDRDVAQELSGLTDIAVPVRRALLAQAVELMQVAPLLDDTTATGVIVADQMGVDEQLSGTYGIDLGSVLQEHTGTARRAALLAHSLTAAQRQAVIDKLSGSPSELARIFGDWMKDLTIPVLSTEGPVQRAVFNLEADHLGERDAQVQLSVAQLYLDESARPYQDLCSYVNSPEVPAPIETETFPPTGGMPQGTNMPLIMRQLKADPHFPDMINDLPGKLQAACAGLSNSIVGSINWPSKPSPNRTYANPESDSRELKEFLLRLWVTLSRTATFIRADEPVDAELGTMQKLCKTAVLDDVTQTVFLIFLKERFPGLLLVHSDNTAQDQRQSFMQLVLLLNLFKERATDSIGSGDAELDKNLRSLNLILNSITQAVQFLARVSWSGVSFGDTVKLSTADMQERPTEDTSWLQTTEITSGNGEEYETVRTGSSPQLGHRIWTTHSLHREASAEEVGAPAKARLQIVNGLTQNGHTVSAFQQVPNGPALARPEAFTPLRDQIGGSEPITRIAHYLAKWGGDLQANSFNSVADPDEGIWWRNEARDNNIPVRVTTMLGGIDGQGGTTHGCSFALLTTKEAEILGLQGNETTDPVTTQLHQFLEAVSNLPQNPEPAERKPLGADQLRIYPLGAWDERQQPPPLEQDDRIGKIIREYLAENTT